METYKSVIKKYLNNPIEIKDGNISDFNTAKQIAKEKALSYSSAPMLLSWYNSKTGDYVPKSQCGRSDKPGWITFAESRGGTIAISVNNMDYVFIFKPYP